MITVRLDVRVSNPLNGSQGQTKLGRMLRSHERKRLRMHADVACRCEHVVKRLPAVITLLRIAPRPLDDDGWQAAAKPIRDGVADYFGVADNDPRITWRYAQRKGGVREYAVEIQIVWFFLRGEKK